LESIAKIEPYLMGFDVPRGSFTMLKVFTRISDTTLLIRMQFSITLRIKRLKTKFWWVSFHEEALSCMIHCRQHCSVHTATEFPSVLCKG
jgi:hypothetical protein